MEFDSDWVVAKDSSHQAEKPKEIIPERAVNRRTRLRGCGISFVIAVGVTVW